MQRYVKLVISLLILITIMTPVVSIFQNSFAERLANSYEQLDGLKSPANTATSLDHIVREGDRLKRKQEEKVIQTVQTEIAAQMKTQLEQETGTKVSQVQVKIEKMEPGDSIDPSKTGQSQVEALKPTIQSIIVHLQPEPPSREQQKNHDNPIAVIKPVEGVQVDVKIEPIGSGQAVEANAEPQNDQISATDQAMGDQVVAWIKTTWGVAPSKVDVYMGDATQIH
jgi:stage III sporulation protein AF